MKNSDYDFFDLDDCNLDEEWNRQPKLFFNHALKLADAKAEQERADAQLDLMAAELDREIRLNPSSFGIEKVTEEVVKKTILACQSYKKALAELIDRKHEADVLKAAVDALDHRKKALENRVHLFGMNYNSEPRVPKNAPEAVKRRIDRVGDDAVLNRKGKGERRK